MTTTYTIYFLLEGAQRTHTITDGVDAVNARIRNLQAIGAKNVHVSASRS